MAKREMIAGRLSDTGFTDKVTGTATSKTLFGAFVSLTYIDDGYSEVAATNENVTGLAVTLDYCVEFAREKSCVTVLRNGRAYALVKKDAEVEINKPAKVGADGVIAADGVEVPHVIVIGLPGTHNDEYDAVQVQVNVPQPAATPVGGGE